MQRTKKYQSETNPRYHRSSSSNMHITINKEDESSNSNNNNNDGSNNPWSFLGVSETDINAVLNDDDLAQTNTSNTNTSNATEKVATIKKRQINTRRGAIISPSQSKKKKTDTTNSPIVRGSNNVASIRKLPITTSPASEKESEIFVTPAKAPPLSQKVQRRKSSLCTVGTTTSINSDDHAALQSITSSTSFLHVQNDCRNDNHYHDEDQKRSETHFVKKSSYFVNTQEGHTERGYLQNDITSTKGRADMIPLSSYNQAMVPPSNDPNKGNNGGTIDINNQGHRQQNYDSSLLPDILDLQMQYQRSIQRMTDSMRQSHQTKMIIQRNHLIYNQQHVPRRRSSFSNAFYRRGSNRRHSSLQLVNQTIVVPTVTASSDNINDYDDDVDHDDSATVTTENIQPRMQAEDRLLEKQTNSNSKDDEKVRDDNHSVLSSYTDTGHHNANHLLRRQSGGSNGPKNDRKFSLTLTSSDFYPDRRRLSSLSHNKNYGPMTTSSYPLQHQLDNNYHRHHLQHQQQHPLHPSMMFIYPTTNVEQSRQMLYHLLLQSAKEDFI